MNQQWIKSFGGVNMKTGKVFLVITVILFFSNCATMRAPENWLPEPEKISEDVYGAWITLKLNNINDYYFLGGEFIGYEEKTVFLLNENGLSQIAVEEIQEAIIDLYQRETSSLTGWTVGMTLSTCSHGFGLIFTAPIWIISGIINSVIASHSGRFAKENPDDDWFEAVKRYSRFPGGISKEVDLYELKLKPSKPREL